ncbi:MAG: AraC family transcriptional regulator [Clostridia bacterium]|nr:AraC family transcriptional regulator [Clostridia bacterium]
MLNYQYKFESLSSESNLDLKLYYCGTEACAPNHCWGPGLKDHYKIHYIYSGKGTFETNGQTYHLESGQGFLIYPNSLATYKADDKNPWTYSWVAFNGRYAEMYLNQTGLSQEHPVFFCDNDDLLKDCFNQIFDACKTQQTNDLRLISSLYLFLALIKEGSGLDSSRQKTVKPRDFYIQRALEFIQTNYSRSLCIHEMAEHLSLNRNYMTKIFKEAVGMTPQTYLINYRMDKACELMKDSYLTIGEISNSVGYSDQLLFSRMFKKFLGISPRNYRNQNI